MIYSILFLVLVGAVYLFWRHKYIVSQVARNLAAFVADGAKDSLQRAFHKAETIRRALVGLACCLVPAAPLAFVSWGAAGLGILSVAALLAGTFARWFTPLLNEARTADRPDITTWYASPASKSWPDAAAWVQVRRAHYLTDADEQAAANILMERIIRRTYRWCLAASLLLAGAAAAVIFMR